MAAQALPPLREPPPRLPISIPTYHPLPPPTSQDPPLPRALLVPARGRFPPPTPAPTPAPVGREGVVNRAAPLRAAVPAACAAPPPGAPFLGDTLTRLAVGAAAVSVPADELMGGALAAGVSSSEGLGLLRDRFFSGRR